MKLAIALHGAGGRMGRAIVRAIAEQEAVSLAAAIDHDGSASLGRDAGELAQVGARGVRVGSDPRALGGAAVAIDFSTPAGTAVFAAACAETSIPLLVGTTGLDAAASNAIDRLAERAPVIVAPNTSIGVNVLFHLAAEATRLLGSDFDAEIVEMHHRNKADAPSGTALRLAERVAAARELDASAFVHGRSGRVGARPDREIGVLALRGGDVIGDHTLVLAGPSERVELTHRAHDRSVFAHGALRAARWLAQPRAPGRYDMADVLGIRQA